MSAKITSLASEIGNGHYKLSFEKKVRIWNPLTEEGKISPRKLDRKNELGPHAADGGKSQPSFQLLSRSLCIFCTSV